MSVRTRFAPSPTGALHIGGIRTALYAYLFAKQNNGTFVLRIEDTDQGRFVEGAEAYIIEALHWCGLTPDEGPRAGGAYGPYRQSERKAIYRQHAQQLIDNGWNPSASGVIGAEMPVGHRGAIGIESGVRWTDGLDSIGDGSDSRISIPVTLRGRVAF